MTSDIHPESNSGARPGTPETANSTAPAEPAVSVIVPVWNAGKYIPECVDSLRGQSLRDIEMIFVDDRGEDDSMDTVRRAAEEDPRIKIIENPSNMGSGRSRNNGIDAASGEYLSFIDSDDYVDSNFLKNLYTLAKKDDLDIVKGKCVMKDRRGNIVPAHHDLNALIRKGLKSGRPLYSLFTYEHAGTLLRTSFIKESRICYGTAARSQDNTFLLRACSRTDRFGIADDAYYYYCERNESSMHREDASSLSGVADSVAEQTGFVLTDLADDPCAPAFIEQILRNSLREYERYLYVEGFDVEKEQFISRLRQEMLRAPFCDRIANSSFSLFMLKEKCAGLPGEPYSLPWEHIAPPDAYARLITKWREAFDEYPEQVNKGVGEFSFLVKRAKESAAYHKDQGSVDKALSGLPAGIRVKMLLSKVKKIRKLWSR